MVKFAEVFILTLTLKTKVPARQRINYALLREVFCHSLPGLTQIVSKSKYLICVHPCHLWQIHHAP